MAALVPLIIAFQAATWENRAGPAPAGLKLFLLALATVYLAAAGYHAFRTLQVSGFQRIVEGEIAAAWGTARPIQRLTRNTLLASRRSRDAVNRKVTSIKVTHQHLIRAFAAFVLLLALDPIFHVADWMQTDAEVPQSDNAGETVPAAVTTPAVKASDQGAGETGAPQLVDRPPTETDFDTAETTTVTGSPEAQPSAGNAEASPDLPPK